MSELAVGSLKGLSANNFVIDVASGSKIVQPGAVLQVVSTAKTDTFSTTSTTPTDITGASVSITPINTANKILVSFSFTTTGSVANHHAVQLLRGTTVIGGGATEGSRLSSISRVYNGSNEGINHVGQFLDSPNTSSSITYSLKIWTNTGTVYVGRGATDSNSAAASDSRTSLTITLMEIAG